MTCSRCGQGEGKYIRYLSKGIALWCYDCFLSTCAPFKTDKMIAFSVGDPKSAIEEQYLKGNEPTPQQYFWLVVEQFYGV